MNMLFINIFVGFMVSEKPRMSVFRHYPYSVKLQITDSVCLLLYNIYYFKSIIKYFQSIS